MSIITSTLGGTTRPGVNGIAPKLPQGDLGPATGERLRRLPGAPPPPLARKPDDFLDHYQRLRLKAEAESPVVNLPYDEEGEPQDWSNSDVAYLVRWWGQKTVDQIADVIGRSSASVKQKAYSIRAKFVAGVRGKKSDGGKGKSRDRAATPEQEDRIHEMRRYGSSISEIVNAMGLTEGQVRHVIRYPRTGGEE